MRLLKDLWNTSKCKREDGHTPVKADLDELVKNPKFPITTMCKDCGIDIRIELDESKPEQYYWVSEL